MASRSPVKMLGTNGGGYTTRMRRIRLRTDPPFRKFIQMLSSSRFPARLPYYLGRMVKSPATAGPSGGDDAPLSGGFLVCWHYEPRQSLLTQLGVDRPTATWKARKYGSEYSNSALFARLTTDASWACQCDARFVHAARRAGPPLSTSNWARSSTRVGRGLYGHAGFCHCRGLHRRMMVGPDARVSRQENPVLRSQNVDVGPPGPRHGHPRLHGLGLRECLGQGGSQQPGSAWFGECFTPTARLPATTAARLPA